MRYVAGAFIILHGLVHAMYVGQALRWFELRDGMTWPTGARFLPTGLPGGAVRVFAAAAIGITSLALVAGGLGILLGADWGSWLTVAAAIVLSVLHILLWNGDLKTAPDQGLYGVVINAVIVAVILAAP